MIETDLAGLAGGREGIYSAGDSLFTTGYEISGPLEAFTTPIDGKGVIYQRKAVEDRDSGKEFLEMSMRIFSCKTIESW